MRMRTYGLVLGAALVLSLTIGTAAAMPSEVETILAELGLMEPPSLTPETGSDSPESASNEKAPARPSMLGNVVGVVLTPVVLVGQSLLSLSLGIFQGFAEGMAEGGRVVAAAGASVASAPVESAVVSSLAVAIASIATWLSVLAKRFGGLGLIPLFSRIAKSELLENNVRQQIFQLIQENPGINVSEISRRLDIAWGTATHHLHKLRQEKMVGIRVASNQKCYFPNGGTYTPREMDVMSVTKHPTAKQIAEFLIRNGPQSHGAIVEALGLTPALVSFHMQKLVGTGIVARHREGRSTIFTPLESDLNPTPRPVSH